MATVRKCSELQQDAPVVFLLKRLGKKIHELGTVHAVNSNNKTVCVSYMEGYKHRYDDVPYSDMVAAYDENGAVMQFDNIRGKSVLLLAE